MVIIEVLAVIFAVIVIIKMATLFFASNWLASFTEKIFSQGWKLLTGSFVIILVIVGYFVLTEVPIQIVLGVMLFTHLLFGMFLVQYPKEVVILVKKVMKDKSKMWLVALIYVSLAVWGIVSVIV